MLLGDDALAERWRQTCRVVAGLGSAAAIVDVADTWPDDLASFIGRRIELRNITELTRARGWAITGVPGAGKTRLAVRAGHVLMARGHFTDLQLAVDLRAMTRSGRPPIPVPCWTDSCVGWVCP